MKCCEACGEVLVARASGRLNPKRRFCDQRCINRAKKMAEPIQNISDGPGVLISTLCRDGM